MDGLQYGRVIVNAETEITDREQNRTLDGLQYGRVIVNAETTFDQSSRLQAPALQYGRVIVNAETANVGE